MKIAVIGTGGVGGFYGGALAKAGYEVLFLARGEHLQVLQTQGLYLETDVELGTVHLPKVFATDQLDQVGVCDLILICLKTFQLERIIPQLKLLVGPQTLLLPLEN